jgi:hypothetical protein
MLVAGAAAVYYLYSQGMLSLATPAPLSIYPEYAYTAQTSMAATNKQQAPAAVLPLSPLFDSVQQQEQSAVYAQCAGGTVCSPVAGDTQLGF